MSGLNSAMNGSSSNLPDTTGRSFVTPFSSQSAAASPVYHQAGTIQGLHSIHGSFNFPNIPGTPASRNSTLNGGPSSGIQQPTGSFPSGRFTSHNLPVALSSISQGNSYGLSGITNRGGISVVGNPVSSSSMNGVSIPGVFPSSIGKQSILPGLGVSPILGNTGPRITSSMGIVGGGNIGRSISSGGGMSAPGLASRLSLTANSGSGGLGMQGPNRLMSAVLQPASPQMISMLGNSYSTAGGPVNQSQVQVGNSLGSMGMLSDVNSNDSSPFDLNDFPQLNGRPSSAGVPQGQLGSLQKQNVGASSIVQQSQEFSIQNEDFPALPGFKGNSDYSMDLHQKEQLHENGSSMMQSQNYPIGRSAGFSFGGTYSSHRPQQQQQHAPSVSGGGVSFTPANSQDMIRLHNSDHWVPSTHGAYHSQAGSQPGIGLRPLNSPNSASGVGSYDQLIQQYQQHQNQTQFRLQQMSTVKQSSMDQGMKSMQVPPAVPDRFGLLGLLSVIKFSDPMLTSLALGIDLTTLGLNLNSTDNLYKTFASPWSDEPAKGDPEYSVPECYYAKPPPALHPGYFSKLQLETLFYIFYSMPKDEAQLYATKELYAFTTNIFDTNAFVYILSLVTLRNGLSDLASLDCLGPVECNETMHSWNPVAIQGYNRGWFYHREHRLWFMRVPNLEPLVKTNTYERGSYICFDPNTWETVRKDNFVLHYESLEKRPVLPQH